MTQTQENQNMNGSNKNFNNWRVATQALTGGEMIKILWLDSDSTYKNIGSADIFLFKKNGNFIPTLSLISYTTHEIVYFEVYY